LRFVTTDELHSRKRRRVSKRTWNIEHSNVRCGLATKWLKQQYGYRAAFLFRFAISVRRRNPLWKSYGIELDESYQLLEIWPSRYSTRPRAAICRRAHGVGAEGVMT